MHVLCTIGCQRFWWMYQDQIGQIKQTKKIKQPNHKFFFSIKCKITSDNLRSNWTQFTWEFYFSPLYIRLTHVTDKVKLFYLEEVEKKKLTPQWDMDENITSDIGIDLLMNYLHQSHRSLCVYRNVFSSIQKVFNKTVSCKQRILRQV